MSYYSHHHVDEEEALRNSPTVMTTTTTLFRRGDDSDNVNDDGAPTHTQSLRPQHSPLAGSGRAGAASLISVTAPIGPPSIQVVATNAQGVIAQSRDTTMATTTVMMGHSTASANDEGRPVQNTNTSVSRHAASSSSASGAVALSPVAHRYDAQRSDDDISGSDEDVNGYSNQEVGYQSARTAHHRSAPPYHVSPHHNPTTANTTAFLNTSAISKLTSSDEASSIMMMNVTNSARPTSSFSNGGNGTTNASHPQEGAVAASSPSATPPATATTMDLLRQYQALLEQEEAALMVANNATTPSGAAVASAHRGVATALSPTALLSAAPSTGAATAPSPSAAVAVAGGKSDAMDDAEGDEEEGQHYYYAEMTPEYHSKRSIAAMLGGGEGGDVNGNVNEGIADYQLAQLRQLRALHPPTPPNGNSSRSPSAEHMAKVNSTGQQQPPQRRVSPLSVSASTTPTASSSRNAAVGGATTVDADGPRPLAFPPPPTSSVAPSNVSASSPLRMSALLMMGTVTPVNGQSPSSAAPHSTDGGGAAGQPQQSRRQQFSPTRPPLSSSSAPSSRRNSPLVNSTKQHRTAEGDAEDEQEPATRRQFSPRALREQALHQLLQSAEVLSMAQQQQQRLLNGAVGGANTVISPTTPPSDINAYHYGLVHSRAASSMIGGDREEEDGCVKKKKKKSKSNTDAAASAAAKTTFGEPVRSRVSPKSRGAVGNRTLSPKTGGKATSSGISAPTASSSARAEETAAQQQQRQTAAAATSRSNSGAGGGMRFANNSPRTTVTTRSSPTAATGGGSSSAPKRRVSIVVNNDAEEEQNRRTPTTNSRNGGHGRRASPRATSSKQPLSARSNSAGSKRTTPQQQQARDRRAATGERSASGTKRRAGDAEEGGMRQRTTTPKVRDPSAAAAADALNARQKAKKVVNIYHDPTAPTIASSLKVRSRYESAADGGTNSSAHNTSAVSNASASSADHHHHHHQLHHPLPFIVPTCGSTTSQHITNKHQHQHHYGSDYDYDGPAVEYRRIVSPARRSRSAPRRGPVASPTRGGGHSSSNHRHASSVLSSSAAAAATVVTPSSPPTTVRFSPRNSARSPIVARPCRAQQLKDEQTMVYQSLLNDTAMTAEQHSRAILEQTVISEGLLEEVDDNAEDLMVTRGMRAADQRRRRGGGGHQQQHDASGIRPLSPRRGGDGFSESGVRILSPTRPSSSSPRYPQEFPPMISHGGGSDSVNTSGAAHHQLPLHRSIHINATANNTVVLPPLAAAPRSVPTTPIVSHNNTMLMAGLEGAVAAESKRLSPLRRGPRAAEEQSIINTKSSAIDGGGPLLPSSVHHHHQQHQRRSPLPLLSPSALKASSASSLPPPSAAASPSCQQQHSIYHYGGGVETDSAAVSPQRNSTGVPSPANSSFLHGANANNTNNSSFTAIDAIPEEAAAKIFAMLQTKDQYIAELSETLRALNGELQAANNDATLHEQGKKVLLDEISKLRKMCNANEVLLMERNEDIRALKDGAKRIAEVSTAEKNSTATSLVETKFDVQRLSAENKALKEQVDRLERSKAKSLQKQQITEQQRDLLEGELRGLLEELKSLTQNAAVTTAENQAIIDGLAKKLSQAETELMTVQPQQLRLVAAEQKTSSLESKLREETLKNVNLVSDLRSLKRLEEKLALDAKQHDELVKAMESRQTELELQLKAFHNDTKKAMMQRHSAEEELLLTQSKLASAERNVELLNEQLAEKSVIATDLQEKVDMLRKDKKLLDVEVNDQSTTIDDLKTALEELQHKIELQNHTISVRKDHASTLSEEASELMDRVGLLEVALEEAESRARTAALDRDRAVAEKKEAERNLRVETEQHLSKVVEMQSSFSTLTGQQSKRLAQAKQEAAELKGDLLAVQQLLAEKEAQYHLINKEAMAERKQFLSTSADLKHQKETVNGLRAQVAKTEEYVAVLEAKINEADVAVTAMQREIGDQNAFIEKQKKSQRLADDRIQSLEKVAKTVKMDQSDVVDLINKNEALSKQLKSLEVKMNAKSEGLRSALEDRTKQQQLILDAQSQLTDVASQSAKVVKNLEIKHQRELNRLTAERDAAEKNFATILSQQEGLEKDAGRVFGILKSVSSGIAKDLVRAMRYTKHKGVHVKKDLDVRVELATRDALSNMAFFQAQLQEADAEVQHLLSNQSKYQQVVGLLLERQDALLTRNERLRAKTVKLQRDLKESLLLTMEGNASPVVGAVAAGASLPPPPPLTSVASSSSAPAALSIASAGIQTSTAANVRREVVFDESRNQSHHNPRSRSGIATTSYTATNGSSAGPNNLSGLSSIIMAPKSVALSEGVVVGGGAVESIPNAATVAHPPPQLPISANDTSMSVLMARISRSATSHTATTLNSHNNNAHSSYTTATTTAPRTNGTTSVMTAASSVSSTRNSQSRSASPLGGGGGSLSSVHSSSVSGFGGAHRHHEQQQQSQNQPPSIRFGNSTIDVASAQQHQPYDLQADLDLIAKEMLGCEGGFSQLMGAVAVEGDLLADRRRRQEELLSKHSKLLGLPPTSPRGGSGGNRIGSPSASASGSPRSAATGSRVHFSSSGPADDDDTAADSDDNDAGGHHRLNARAAPSAQSAKGRRQNLSNGLVGSFFRGQSGGASSHPLHPQSPRSNGSPSSRSASSGSSLLDDLLRELSSTNGSGGAPSSSSSAATPSFSSRHTAASSSNSNNMTTASSSGRSVTQPPTPPTRGYGEADTNTARPTSPPHLRRTHLVESDTEGGRTGADGGRDEEEGEERFVAAYDRAVAKLRHQSRSRSSGGNSGGHHRPSSASRGDYTDSTNDASTLDEDNDDDDGNVTTTITKTTTTTTVPPTVNVALASPPHAPNVVFYSQIPTSTAATAPNNGVNATPVNADKNRNGGAAVVGKTQRNYRSSITRAGAGVSSNSGTANDSSSDEFFSDDNSNGNGGKRTAMVRSSLRRATAITHSSITQRRAKRGGGGGRATDEDESADALSGDDNDITKTASYAATNPKAALLAEEKESARLAALEAHVRDLLLRCFLKELQKNNSTNSNASSHLLRPMNANNGAASAGTTVPTASSAPAAALPANVILQSDKRDLVTDLLPLTSRLSYLLEGHLSAQQQQQRTSSNGGIGVGKENQQQLNHQQRHHPLKQHPLSGRVSQMSVGELVIKCVDAYLRTAAGKKSTKATSR